MRLLSFRVAPGLRLTASSRGLSAGIGPRAARVHIGSRGGIGVSTGQGPFSVYQSLGSWKGSSGGPSLPAAAGSATAAARNERAQLAAELEEIERALLSAHRYEFPPAKRHLLPPPEPVDEERVRAELAEELRIAKLEQALDGTGEPPVAPPPEPVDRYALLREARREATTGVPLLAFRERREALRKAREAAESKAAAEESRRERAREVLQAELDQAWQELCRLRTELEQRLPGAIEARQAELERERDEAQREIDAAWEALLANQPEAVMAALEEAFEDNSAPAAPVNCEGAVASVAVLVADADELVPSQRPALTKTGQPTVKKRTKTERNEFYLRAIASAALATASEAFAVAPSIEKVRLVVLRKGTSDVEPICAFERDRASHRSQLAEDPLTELERSENLTLNLRGRTREVASLLPEYAEELDEIVAAARSAFGDGN